MNMETIMKAIDGSELFERLNKVCKDKCIEMGYNPTEEEYTAIRSMLIYKTILEDKEVFKTVSKMVFDELNK